MGVQTRSSALHFGMPWRTPPQPTGSINQAERQAAAFLYSGILATTSHTPSPDTGTGGRLVMRPYWIGRHTPLSGIYKIPPP